MRRLTDAVLTWLRRWESDKWIHVVAFLLLAWAIARVLDVVMVPLYTKHITNVIIGSLAASGLAIAKEFYDKHTTGLFDKQDLWASLVGIVLFIVMNVL